MSVERRIVGLDVGDVRIGVAVSDGLGITAQPREVIRRSTPEKDVQAIRTLVEEAQAGQVVVGLPLTQRGEIGHQARKVLDFVERLRGELKAEVVTLDERFTTTVAERSPSYAEMSPTRRKETVDKLAAQQILQTYLDRMRHRCEREKA